MLRFGVVSTVDPGAGTVTVIVPDKAGQVSEALPLIDSIFKMPKVGEKVACVFTDEGLREGVCLGRFFAAEHLPGDVLMDWGLDMNGPLVADNATIRENVTVFDSIEAKHSITPDSPPLQPLDPPEYPK